MPESRAYPGAPRWAKVMGIVSLALALLFVVVHLAGGGFRHHAHLGGEVPSGVTPKGGN